MRECPKNSPNEAIFLSSSHLQFSGPKGIAVNRSGHVVVVDNKASCILVFQPNGKLVQRFGSRGSEANKFAGPHFVAINSQDHIIVSDFHNHSIKVRIYLCRKVPK